MELLISDLQVAAYLVAKGHNLLDVRPDGTAHGVFVFSSELKDEADAYFRDGQVSARRFAYAIRELKSRVRVVTR